MRPANLAASYVLAARTTRREARNFYYAFLTLPRSQRLAVYALYAFFRELDDVADAVVNGAPSDVRHSPREKCDGAALLRGGSTSRTETTDESAFLASAVNPVDSRRAGIHEMRHRLTAMVAGRPSCDRDLAMADAMERFSIEPSDIEDVVRGVEMDLEPVEMATLDDLERYACLVASAVGLATLSVLNDGVPPTDEMRDRAIRLGLGMQLVNVVRDVGEDAAQRRIYVPRELLERHGARSESIESHAMTPELRAALAELGARARDHLRAGRELMAYVPRPGRACLWLLSEVYTRILTRIEESRYDVFSSRISLPRREKLWLLATARWRA